MEPKKQPRNAPIWIKIFVAAHIVMITAWSLPNPKKPYMFGTAKLGVDASSPKNFVRSFSETVTEGTLYFNWKYLKNSPMVYYAGPTGFWQFWDMFSPNPASVDLYLEADVLYQDGTKKRFKFPRIYTMSIPAKYVKERYRKFYENANQDDQAFIRPSVAQRIALESTSDPKNLPVQVSLIRFFDVVEPPGKPWNPAYSEVRYFTHQVDLPKLRRDKGYAN